MGNLCVFPFFSLYYVNSLLPCFGNYMDFCFTQNIKETHKFGMFAFPMLFLCYGNPLFLGTAWISASYEKFKKPLTFKCLYFTIVSLHYENSSSHVLRMVWTFASPEIFEKHIILKCFFFPILFLYYGNSLFPCFENCMDFCFTWNIYETHKIAMFVFSHTFPVLWKTTFLIFWELHEFLLQAKNLRNP